MRVAEKDRTDITTNNCLIDCHLDVWTRFPVQAAIQRENISPLRRSRQSLTFLTDDPEAPFAAYFDGLIRSLHDNIHKTTNGVLSNIKVSASRHVDFCFQHLAVSLYSAGEWVVELLCLIPLHLAVTHKNRFIPLKDGIWSPEYERELLGADVGQIVDALSLGWYESLFQSYMVSKVGYFHFIVIVCQADGHMTITASSSGQLYGSVYLCFIFDASHRCLSRRAICWEKLLFKPLCRHFICWVSDENSESTANSLA